MYSRIRDDEEPLRSSALEHAVAQGKSGWFVNVRDLPGPVSHRDLLQEPENPGMRDGGL